MLMNFSFLILAVTTSFISLCDSFMSSSPSSILHLSPSLRNQIINQMDMANNDNNPNDEDDGSPRKGSLEEATKRLGSVPYGELSRKYRRTVFKHKDWINHRSNSSRIGGVVRQLRPQVSAVTSIAVLLLIWDVMGNNYLDLPVLSLPTLPFTLSSPALGLLLVFRTNAAYFRWMSGRDAWARMIIHCKNLVRMASVFSTDVEAVEEFSKVVWLYCRTVMNKLSSPDEDEEVYKEQVQEVFRSSLIGEKVISSSDRVVCAWKQMSIQLHSLPSTDPKALIETDKSIIILGECTAICEKIYSSPVPLVYTRHTARYLSVFALLLPFALYSSFSSEGEILFLIPASAIIGFFLFGVDELAMQLEEPFSILPLQVFCDEIYESNKLMVDKDDSIKEQSQVSM